MEVLSILGILVAIVLCGILVLGIIGGIIDNFWGLLGWAIFFGGMSLAASLWNSGWDNLGATIGLASIILLFVVGNYNPKGD